MVFQDYALFPHLTVEANIAFALHRMPSVQRQNRIRELLVILGLEQYPKRYPHQLSGGQQQRVALARALAPRPGVVLLDEPFSNLDAALRKSTREEVHQILRHSATTTVFVTHDQEEALSMADWVGVMADGELKQVGTPRQLYDTPVSPEVALFVGQANRIEGIATGAQVQTILGVLPLRQPHTGPVEVFIRPENLKLSAEDGSPALVERDIYYGTHQTVWLRLEDGTRLKMNTNPQTVLRAEEQVRVVVRGSVVAFKSG
jgi:iron(III) transport system ATP-binding protein